VSFTILIENIIFDIKINFSAHQNQTPSVQNVKNGINLLYVHSEMKKKKVQQHSLSIWAILFEVDCSISIDLYLHVMTALFIGNFEIFGNFVR
jgi:hypothetical protein